MANRTKKINVRLPNKLHAMLTKALDDVERLEKSKKYAINMDVVAKRDCVGGVCELCLGGSQLVGHLPRGEFEMWFNSDEISKSLRKKLIALDELRQGHVHRAVNSVKGIASHSKNYFAHHDLNLNVVDYHDNPKFWKAQMRLLAAHLEEANL